MSSTSSLFLHLKAKDGMAGQLIILTGFIIKTSIISWPAMPFFAFKCRNKEDVLDT